MRNSDWTEREHRVLGAVMQRTSDPMYGPVLVRGQGSRVWDAEDRCYFDLTCGYSAANFGHAFPPLVAAAEQQLTRLTHLTGLSHPGRAQLAERLVEHCGTSDDRVIFNTCGARAIETAMKVAWSARPGQIVSIAPAYHGRSLATAMLSDTVRAVALEPTQATQATQLWHQRPLAEFAYCRACPAQLTYPSCHLACQNSLLEWIQSQHRSISAVIVEPAIGARGYIAPPAEYWCQLRELTRRHGILMIADEIQMGLGRSGHWLLSRAQGWQADLIVLGKSLGGGIAPVSAVIGARGLIDLLPPGSESETFSASPLAMAVGCAVIDQLANGPWLRRAHELGQRLRSALCDSRRSLFPPDVQIDCLGAAVAVEFFNGFAATAAASQLPANPAAIAAARNWSERWLAAGLIVHYSGPYATRVVLLPALTMTDQELAEVTDILAASGTGSA